MTLPFYRETILHVKDIRTYLLTIFAFFAAGTIVGFLRPMHFPDSFRYLTEIADFLKNSSIPTIVIFLFIKNALASFLALWAGSLMGGFPLFAAAQNGYLMGAVLSLQADPLLSFLNILPHGIFELPAFFLACAIGLWRGFWIFRKNKEESYQERAQKGYFIFLRLVLPFLVIAAVIEGVRIGLA